MLLCQLLTFFNINLFKKFYQEHYQSVKQFGSRSGRTFLSVLIWVQTIYKEYQQMTKVVCALNWINTVNTCYIWGCAIVLIIAWFYCMEGNIKRTLSLTGSIWSCKFSQGFLFSRNFAYAKFCENKILAKCWNHYVVYWYMGLDLRKLAFRGLRTTGADQPAHLGRLLSTFVIR